MRENQFAQEGNGNTMLYMHLHISFARASSVLSSLAPANVCVIACDMILRCARKLMIGLPTTSLRRRIKLKRGEPILHSQREYNSTRVHATGAPPLSEGCIHIVFVRARAQQQRTRVHSVVGDCDIIR